MVTPLETNKCKDYDQVFKKHGQSLYVNLKQHNQFWDNFTPEIDIKSTFSHF